MPDISALYTIQTKPSPPAQGPVGASSTLAGGNGVFGNAGAGLSFFDMIFAITGGKALAGQQPDQLTTPPAPDTLQSTDTESGITDFNLVPSETAAAVTLDSAGHKKLTSALENMLHGMPEDQQHIVLKIAPGQLKKAAETLNIALPKNGANPDAANLIATGLTPEQLTDLVNMIAAGKDIDIDIDAATQALLVGLVKIMPDGSRNEAIFLPRALVISKTDPTSVPETDEPGEEISTSLDALTLTPVTANIAQPATDIPVSEDGFDSMVKTPDIVQAKDSTGQKTTDPAPPGPLNSTLGSSFAAMMGSIMSPSGLNDVFPEGLDWSQNTVAGPGNLQITSTAQLASLVTQATHASHPHSVTHIVAASLIKSAQSGENQTLKLQLNPPELGRIEVHMQFTKDKTMKAHMVIEKPETMLMLQRDAQVLERALQEAGMESGGGNLSFELSGDRNDSGNDGNGTNGTKHAEADDNEIEMIETTMTWYVDADTGHQRYNILA